MNRRNVLIGMSGLAVGGGALLGSGAFTSVQANRTVEVNVTTGSAIADEYVDVLVYAGGYSSVDVGSNDPPSGGSTTDPTTVFPQSGDSYASWTPTGNLEDWVSLIDNNLNIEFGRQSGLPDNSQVSYDPLFAVVNDNEGTNPADYDVYLEYDDASSGDVDSEFLEIAGTAKGTSETPLSTGSSVEYNSVVDTVTGSDGDTLVLTIRIE